MTAHDIIRIALTVAVTQCGIDLLANRLVFKRDSYQRAISTLNRAQMKLDKVLAASSSPDSNRQQNAKSLDKQAKKIQRAQDDVAEASADVAKRHMAPNFWGSLIFVILYRILSTEYSGKVVAVLPFVPFSLLRRLTLRGLAVGEKLEWTGRGVSDVNQACGFLFVYILCTVSVKFIVHKLIGVSAPKGADKGIMTMMEAPKSQRMLKSLGVDTDVLKQQ